MQTQIHIYVSEELKAQIKARADLETEGNINYLLRKIIREYLDK